PPIRRCNEVMAPLPELADAAKGCGFIDFLEPEDVVRSLPLWTDDRGGLVPQMALALACVYLDVDPRDVTVTARQVTLRPRGKPPIEIPVRTVSLGGSNAIGTMMEVPLFGTADWLTMYDYPAHRQSAQHETILKAWDVTDTRRRIRDNNLRADGWIGAILDASDKSALERFRASRPAPEDVAGRARFVDNSYVQRVLQTFEQES